MLDNTATNFVLLLFVGNVNTLYLTFRNLEIKIKVVGINTPRIKHHFSKGTNNYNDHIHINRTEEAKAGDT